jgi:hypothetical protein
LKVVSFCSMISMGILYSGQIMNKF